MKRFFKRSINKFFIDEIVIANNKFRKALTIIALIGILGTFVPTKPQVEAESPVNQTEISSEITNERENYPSTTDQDFDAAMVDIVCEDKSLRTENTKTFQKKDGTYVVAIYNDAVHYWDEGEFKDIDNSLAFDEENQEYKNKANKFSIKLPKSINDNKKIQLSWNGYELAWTLIGGQESKTGEC